MMILITALCTAWANNFQGRTEMNGISYQQYEGFEDKWRFVTVRFRTDTREQRFVWANDIALKALEGGVTDFPDGAVFAKIGFATEEDPAFKSSLNPSGSKRFQFMVRDKSRYAATGGWGYALFDGNKKTYDGDFGQQAQACAACHQLVANRGQVFTVPLKVSAFAAKPPPMKEAPEVDTVKFATVAAKDLPPEVRKHLPAGRTIQSVKGELRKHVFRGTIDEIRPSLIDEARRTGRPAALIADKSSQFAAVFREPRKDCPKDRAFKSVFSTEVPSQEPGTSSYYVVATQNLCL
jgi:hypothetical protein